MTVLEEGVSDNWRHPFLMMMMIPLPLLTVRKREVRGTESKIRDLE